jgi:poly-beta-1,6-N-acetyl-D-glucosamine synthase
MRPLNHQSVQDPSDANSQLPSMPSGGLVARESRTVRYCIVTSTRDEEKFIAATIEAVVAQTILPMEWIIVNDGSKDRTAQIIGDYAARFSWIRVIHRQDRGFRSTGGGIHGFIEGYQSLSRHDWDFLVNLDGDLTFSPEYFEGCFQRFAANPKLGIAGGTIYNQVGTHLECEECANFHVRGATKIYRRDCWTALEGMHPGLGWDTVDEIKANMRGWITLSFPDLMLIHHRFTGTAEGRWWGLVKDGEADYIVGYHPIYFLAKCLRRLFRRPVLVGAIGLGYGFLRSYVHRDSRINNRDFIRYVRRQQLRRLFGLKSIWR